MSIIIKKKYEKNESPYFNSFEEKLNKKKNSLILHVFIIFCLLITVLIYLLAYQEYIILNMLILLMLIGLFISFNKDIEQILSLTSYQEYFDSNLSEKSKKKGDQGELSFIKYVLEKLKDNNYKILNNIYIPNQDNHPLQVDTIIIGPSNSLYIIEVKNWYGLITGQIDEQKWFTETGYRTSPYKQNEKHLKSLKKEMEKILDQSISAYNIVINMDKNSYLNICKYDKNNNCIYQNVEELLLWILRNEEELNLEGVNNYNQNQIISAIYQIHYNALFEWEKKLNYKLFDKYHHYLNEEIRKISSEPQLT